MDDAELQTLITAELYATYEREVRLLRNKVRRESKKETIHDTEDIQNEIDTGREHDEIPLISVLGRLKPEPLTLGS